MSSVRWTCTGVDRRERIGRTQRFGVAGSARGMLDLPPAYWHLPDSVSFHLALLCNTFALLCNTFALLCNTFALLAI